MLGYGYYYTIILSIVDIPCSNIHGQSTYAPVAANCAPLGYPEALAYPGYLPPFNPVSFTPPMYSPQTSMEEAITIKKEPNYPMPSPPGLYHEHPYPQEHFPFPPVCRLPRPPITGKL